MSGLRRSPATSPSATRLQVKLKDSERQFRLLVSGVTDYALYMLSPEGRVTSWNQGGEKIKGYTPDEIIGQHFSRFYRDADRESGKPARALSIAETTGRYEEEGWRVRKDGSFFWASVVIDAIRDEDGKLVGFAKVTRDITERRNSQIALTKVERHLAEAQKMEAMGTVDGRHRARFQQPADDCVRTFAHDQTCHRRRSQAQAGRAGD